MRMSWRDLKDPAEPGDTALVGHDGWADARLGDFQAQASPKCDLLVLCGHTRGSGEVQIRENLRVLTGPADDGKPQVQRIIAVD